MDESQLARRPGEDMCLFHSKDEKKPVAEFRAALAAKKASGDGNYVGFVFPEWADFSVVTFTGDADFGEANFTGAAHFFRATFTGDANFGEANFTGAADFWGATFTGDANFFRATFTGDADFWGANFTGAAHFWGARLDGPGRVVFQGDEEKTVFHGRADFRGAYFGTVLFRSVHLKDATFAGCYGLEKVEFDNVTWGSIDQPWRDWPLARRLLRWRRENVVGDELEARKTRKEGDFAVAEGVYFTPGAEQGFAAAERVYRMLRKSYKDREDYAGAREFYFGQMEMRRLARKGWRKWLSLTTAFWLLSGYGTRWRRAAGWAVLLLLLWALLYAFSGLRLASDPPGVAHTLALWGGTGAFFWDGLRIIGYGLIHSLEATIVRTDFARPAHNWGWLFQTVQNALGPTIIAMLVLAIREQFKK
ncbi:MAG: pentapeptide repeat-containing protein [Chloroflexi bacterium]|nr:pentapeptide repeat-containing protein [Chloroflexota bacterium]